MVYFGSFLYGLLCNFIQSLFQVTYKVIHIFNSNTKNRKKESTWFGILYYVSSCKDYKRNRHVKINYDSRKTNGPSNFLSYFYFCMYFTIFCALPIQCECVIYMYFTIFCAYVHMQCEYVNTCILPFFVRTRCEYVNTCILPFSAHMCTLAACPRLLSAIEDHRRSLRNLRTQP